MKKVHVFACMMFMAIVMLLAACGSGNSDGGGAVGNGTGADTNSTAGDQSGSGGTGVTPPDSSKANEIAAVIAKATSSPVEIDVYIHTGSYKIEQFMEFYGDAVVKKYPNFSFNLLVPSAGTTLPELFAQGINIDLIQSHRANTYELMYDTQLQTDISELIKKYNFDLYQIEPVVLEEMKQLGKGGILGLPYESRVTALFYNRDLFRKFGVDEPKDKMMWNETLDLARRLSRVEDGVSYYGFLAYPRHVFLMNQLSQGYVDVVNNKATLNNDQWKKVFETLTQFHQITDNPYPTVSKVANTFWKDGVAAMYASMFVPDAPYIRDAEIDWDVTALPEMAERPGIGSGMLNYYFNLTHISKNRDQAFLAAAFLASAEYQEPQARKGYNSALRGGQFKEAIGKDVPYYAERHLSLIRSDSPAGSYAVNQYQSIVDKILDSAFEAIYKESKDINTVLREADEQANKKIEEAIAAGN